MKFPLLFKLSVVAVLLLWPILAAHGGPARTAKAKAAAVTNAAPTVVEIPQSAFTLPANPRDGRDPFFPDSIRPYSGGIVRSKEPTRSVKVGLNGVSADFIMVNGKTIGKGEEVEVTTPGGRVKVRCLEIRLNTNSAIVEVNGERQELRLKDR